MLANLDAIFKHLKKDRVATGAGQQSLFGAPTEDDLRLVELPDWDLDTKLWYERKATGGFLSAHPADPYIEKHKARITHGCHQAFDMLGGYGKFVVVGLVKSFRRLARISFLEISDHRGTVEIIAFNDAADQFEHVLTPDNIVAVQLKARHDRGASLELLQAHRVGVFRPKA